MPKIPATSLTTTRVVDAIERLNAADAVEDGVWNLGCDACAAVLKTVADSTHRLSWPELARVVDAVLRAVPDNASLRAGLEAIADRSLRRTAMIELGLTAEPQLEDLMVAGAA